MSGCDNSVPDECPNRAPESAAADSGAAQRRRLLEFNREKIEFSYEKACRAGMPEAIVLVLDLADDFAAAMAAALGAPHEHIRRCRSQCLDTDSTPVYVVAVAPCLAFFIVGGFMPTSIEGVVKPCPTGTFRVAAFSAGGMCFADCPLPPNARLAGDVFP